MKRKGMAILVKWTEQSNWFIGRGDMITVQ